MSSVTWRAVIRLGTGDQVPVQVRAATQDDARQLIELQYGKGPILFGPNRVDLTRSIWDQRDGSVDRSPARNRLKKRIPKNSPVQSV